MTTSTSIQHPRFGHEWLEADGLGGFASGTSSGIRTRRYHALLLTAQTPPTGRIALVNGFDAWIENAHGKFALTSQCYAPDVVTGDSARRLKGFGIEPWPHWIFKLDDGTPIEHELFVVKGAPVTCLSWRVPGPRREGRLFVRPFVSGRDYHSTHKCNPAFRFDAEVKPNHVVWHPYHDLPAVAAVANGSYQHNPLWYYNFLYEEERARGLDCEEDLAAPGVFSWDLSKGPATLVLTTRAHAAESFSSAAKPLEIHTKLRDRERKRRGTFASGLELAADAYIVERRSTVRPGDDPVEKTGRTIIAGYPWFTDWGRDTFIALRGLCLATGRMADARAILLEWAGAVSQGMLPNRFPDRGEEPEFNSVDASLWFIVAAHEYLEARKQRSRGSAESAAHAVSDEQSMVGAMEQIIEGYARGARFGIRCDEDGLLSAGTPGSQLTWMDAKVGDRVITPRCGKPVEIQALWLNALAIAGRRTGRWIELHARGVESFLSRFWNPERNCLFDVVDVNHERDRNDSTIRPNQIFAIGGLPFSVLDGARAREVLACVEKHLLTPAGLRSLAPLESGYAPRYAGGVQERDSVYHQGTVWPWLLGAFIEAWVRVKGGTNGAKREAREKFFEPWTRWIEQNGLTHVAEITDADDPHSPRGCPFQAWSVGEVLRIDRVVLAETREPVMETKRKREPVLL